jgi:hypothetical protein
MESPQIVFTDAPEASELAVIRERLSAFNLAASGIDDQRPVALLVKHRRGGRPHRPYLARRVVH